MQNDLISASLHSNIDIRGRENTEMQYLAILQRDGSLQLANFMYLAFSFEQTGEIAFHSEIKIERVQPSFEDTHMVSLRPQGLRNFRGKNFLVVIGRESLLYTFYDENK